jgi:hypothetical protein
LFAFTAGCATNPATGERQFSLMSEGQELEAGRQNDAQVRKEMGVYDTARQGDTWQGIAERQVKGLVKAATLAIMNGRTVSDQPLSGERLKIVAGG